MHMSTDLVYLTWGIFVHPQIQNKILILEIFQGEVADTQTESQNDRETSQLLDSTRQKANWVKILITWNETLHILTPWHSLRVHLPVCCKVFIPALQNLTFVVVAGEHSNQSQSIPSRLWSVLVTQALSAAHMALHSLPNTASWPH